jgi:hypothetical protein
MAIAGSNPAVPTPLSAGRNEAFEASEESSILSRGTVAVQSQALYILGMPYRDPVMQRDFQKEWIAARRVGWLAENGPCALCGSRRNLEVDHVDPEKKVSHRVWSWSKERRDAELAKCQVLCGRCHKKKSVEYQRRHTTHGLTMYTGVSRCRCRACCAANTEYRRQWRVKNRAQMS